MRHFRPVKPGDKIRPLASEWNDVRQTSVDFRFGNPNPSDPSSIGGAANPVVKVRNDQPDDVPAYGVLAVTGPLHESDSLYAQMAHAADRWIDVLGGPPTGDVDEILCIPQHFARAATSTSCIVMGPTPAWVYVNDTSHLYARAIPENVQMLESAESGPVRLMYAPSKTGLQIIPVLLGMPVVGESPIHAKELFPAVVYRRYREERIDDETVVQVPETFVVCPGGRGTDRSIKTVHVLHVEGKTVSTSLFGALPVAANNFGAVLADDGFGGKILVCAPGEVDEGSWYPVQRYSFAEQEWVKTNSAQSLAGCPAYLLDGEVRIAGGQGGYSVSDAVQLTAGNPMTGKQAEYGHLVTPLWKIDAATGVLDKRTPLRRIVSGFSPSPTCYTVDQEKRFLKQNFSGIPVARASDGLSVEFLAVGGTELLGYQSKACVSYRVDSTYGPYVDCETNPTGTVTKCEIFPDTPVPLGECCAVRVTRRRSGTMSVDGDWLVC
ncbi:MAG TPA: hypothetical protein DEB39_16800, partial [Planctomycetaceae bacterium]|nr:hypothetical protein [Planctomycetaceae bacterium]